MKIKKPVLITGIIMINIALLFLQGCFVQPQVDLKSHYGNSSTEEFPDINASSEKTENFKDTTTGDATAAVTGNNKTGESLDTLGPDSVQTGTETFQKSSRTANITISYFFDITGNTSRIEFISVIPDDYQQRQDAKEITFNTEPFETFISNNTKYAKFLFTEPAVDFKLDINIKMEIFDYDLQAAMISAAKKDALPLSSQEHIKYTSGEKNIDTDDPSILKAAQKFDETDQLKLVRQIYDFVLESLYYQGYNPGDCGAAGALSKSGGDCTEYADLFVALCRVKGIPARVIEGYTADAPPSEMPMGHNWSEAYIKDIGWVPFDCIFDDNNGNSKETTFDNLKDVYIYNSFVRNDPELLGYHYFAYYYYGDEISVEKSVSINL